MENDGWNPRKTELDHFLAHPATPEEVDYRVLEEQMGLVEWTVYSPVGTRPLPSVLDENPNLRTWFHSPFWMDQVHRSVRETFLIPETCQTLVPPGPFAMEDGTMVFFRVADTRQGDGNRFPHEIMVEIPLDDSLHPTGPPRAFVSDRVLSSAHKNTGKPRVRHLLILVLTLLMLGVVALIIRSLLTRSIMEGAIDPERLSRTSAECPLPGSGPGAPFRMAAFQACPPAGRSDGAGIGNPPHKASETPPPRQSHNDRFTS